MTRMVITGYRNVTRFSVLSVPGGSHGTLSAGTFMAQRGRSRPASSANISAIPASSADVMVRWAKHHPRRSFAARRLEPGPLLGADD